MKLIAIVPNPMRRLIDGDREAIKLAFSWVSWNHAGQREFPARDIIENQELFEKMLPIFKQIYIYAIMSGHTVNRWADGYVTDIDLPTDQSSGE